LGYTPIVNDKTGEGFPAYDDQKQKPCNKGQSVEQKLGVKLS
jgi:hypothetical protein